MEISIEEMTLADLEYINLKDFDDFWSKNLLKDELLSASSYYIVAKSENNIIGFAGIKFLLDEAHITNIAVRTDKRNNRYWLRAFDKINRKSKGSYCINNFRSK